MKSRIALSFVSLLVCLTALPLGAAEWMVPAAAHAPGASNTNWRTDLRVVNPAATAASVRIDLLPANTDNTARSRTATVNVPAQGQLSLVDVLDTQFDFTGTGALLVTSDESSLIVTSRTYNEAAGGATYGQFIPGVPVASALGSGVAGNLIYLTKTDDYRTNVGFAGTTATAGTVTITLYNAAGSQLGSGSFPVLPYGQSQVNDVFVSTGSAAAAVARAVVTATVPVVAYASIIDNRTGDPIAMVAQRNSETSTLFAIPGVAHAPGASNSTWRSDVRVYYPGQGTVPLTLTYYPANTANPTPVQKTMSIGAGQILSFDDIVLGTFNIDNGSGGLRIESTSPLFTTSRTFNLTSSATYGQDIPAVPYSLAFDADETVVFSGLSDSGYRTNVGFFNLSGEGVDLTLTLKGPDGTTLATKAFRLEANMMTQFNLFTYLGLSGTSAASLSIVGTGASTYVAYASIIDNRSGDPVFVPASKSTASQPTGGGNGCTTLPFMRAGLRLEYKTSDNLYHSIQTVTSDSATKTELHDEATTGGQASKIDSTFDYVTQGNFRAMTHMLSKATVQVSGFTITTNTDITWSPALVISPLSEFCAGTTFNVPATTQTVQITGSFPGPTTVTQRPAFTAEILGVGVSVTTAAGTFSTVHYKSTQGATQSGVVYSITWYDIASGALVRQIQYDASNQPLQTLDLISIQ